VAFAVSEASSSEVRDGAVTGDEDECARELSLIDVALEVGVHVAKAGGIEAEFGGGNEVGDNHGSGSRRWVQGL
jgi:hypothetical protein